MYMRLLTLKPKPWASSQFREFYEQRVLPGLQETEGCLYATLSESVTDSNECISLTLWDSQEHMEAYGSRGKFKQFMRESEVFLEDTAEWRVELSEDLTVEYKNVRDEPTVTSYGLRAAMHKEKLSQAPDKMSYLRLVRLQVKAGASEEVKQYYAQDAIPALKAVQGCRYACLMGNLAVQDELVSVTIWDSKEDAERYERGEVFRELMKSAGDLLPLYHWKMGLESLHGGQVHTSDVNIKSYSVVAGRSFEAD